MRVNKTKHLMRNGRPAIGTFCFLSEPAIVDMAGLAGFDFVIIDQEHAGKDLAVVEGMVRAAEAADVTPLVRVRETDEKAILQLLEMGAQGIVVPCIDSPETARLAARSMRYPPEGIRGTCRSTRAASYGMQSHQFEEHMRRCNEELLLVGLIEDKKGVEQIDAILAEGFDVCFLGRADLSSSLGVPGQLDNPDVLAAVDRVLTATKRANCVAGNITFSASEAKKMVDEGYLFIVYSTDTQILMRSLHDAVAQTRQALA